MLPLPVFRPGSHTAEPIPEEQGQRGIGAHLLRPCWGDSGAEPSSWP